MVVDRGNCVRIIRTVDEARTPPGMRWPEVVGKDVSLLVPAVQKAPLCEVLLAVRQLRAVRTWRFPSAIVPGEFRLLRAYPAKRVGWVAISVLALFA